MDSKVDNYDFYCEFENQQKNKLVTYCRELMAKSEKRYQMIEDRHQQHKQIYKMRGYCVEKLQGLIKEIFNLNRYWMKGLQ